MKVKLSIREWERIRPFLVSEAAVSDIVERLDQEVALQSQQLHEHATLIRVCELFGELPTNYSFSDLQYAIEDSGYFRLIDTRTLNNKREYLS